MYIHVKVKAGVKKESLVVKSKTLFHVSVKEKAERNMANNRILELISEYFKVPKNKVKIINGHQNPSKLLSLDL